MKFAIMGMEPRGEWERLDGAEQNQRVRRHQEILNELVRSRLGSGPPGLIFASFGLGAERDVVTVRCESGGHACTDGPFPETKEVVGGFDIIEFASRQAATEWAAAQAWHASQVSEVREIGELWWLSNTVDRERLMRFEHWQETTPRGEQAAPLLYMFTAFEDRRAAAQPGDRARIAREHQRVAAEYARLRSTVDHQPGMWVAAQLAASAAAVTVRGAPARRVIADGPADPSVDAIGGFHVIACTAPDEAIAWARKLATREGDVIEVRPVRGSWWVYHE